MTKNNFRPIDIQSTLVRLENNIASVVLGKREVIRLALVALLSNEHLLLEDVPGVGKTLLALALAKSLAADSKRIQFTPDLVPADITGGNIFNMKTGDFEFFPGPVFTNVLLADEINRTTPRTQSALLEAMSQRQVSCDGQTRHLPEPFMVMATENPIEFEGTYPLPESQLDRFLLRISIGYPGREDELQILRSHQKEIPIDKLQPILDCNDLLQIQEAVRNVNITDDIRRYILDICTITRNTEELFVGVSIRGAISFCRAAQALALLEGRGFVIPDDVKRLAIPVLAHRIILKGAGHSHQRQSAEALIERIVQSVAVPV